VVPDRPPAYALILIYFCYKKSSFTYMASFAEANISNASPTSSILSAPSSYI
jgi:hypothetical protein